MKTMDTPTGDVEDSSPVQTTGKKLRQALLPFQIVSPVGVASTTKLPCKKRKLTDEVGNGKINKNLRLDNQSEELVDCTEAKENMIVLSPKIESSSFNNASGNILTKPTENQSCEEDNICLQLEDDDDEIAPQPVKVKESEESVQKDDVESDPQMKPIAADPPKDTVEMITIDNSDDNEQSPLDSSVDLDSADGKEQDEANLTLETTFDKSGRDDSDAKDNSSGSVESLVKSTTDMSTPNHLQNDSKSPRLAMKKKPLSTKQKEQRGKVKEELERKKEERRKEKERLREERLEQKKREIAEKKQRMQERLSLKLEEKQKKEEEKNQKKKQKEEERQRREEKKEEERLKKEEERLKKEEEKQKREEERLKSEEKKKIEKEEEEKKKTKAAAAFASFFVAKKSVQNKSLEEEKIAERKFMPFMVKGDMRLAPTVRGCLNEGEKDDVVSRLNEQSEDKLYLKELKEKVRLPKTFPPTWPLSELKNEVTIIEEDDDVPPSGNGDGLFLDVKVDLHLRPKLLQFCENQRPPYWGTWRKRSKRIRPRCPLEKDEKYFDYEVDSDDEWEEEEPGESLHGSDDEKESEDEYEVDNEFFVPHGYLSNEEADGEEEEEAVSPETQKAKLKLLGIEFEEEMKQQTRQIKPQLLGCFWSYDSSSDEHLNLQYERIFMPYKAVVCCQSIPTSFTTLPNSSTVGASGGQLEGSGRKKTVFPESSIPDLIRLIHGNVNSYKFLVMEFVMYYEKNLDPKERNPKEHDGESPASSKCSISKLSTARKIKELASRVQLPEGSASAGKFAWFVPDEIREQFGLMDLAIPNSWKYNLKPTKMKGVKLTSSPTSPSVVASEVAIESPVSVTPKRPLITKFTKVLSKEERLKQLKQKPKGAPISSPVQISPSSGSTSQSKPSPKGTVIGTSPSSEINSSIKSSASNCSDPKVRKRVPLLVSVPRGQEIPRSYSLTSFLKQPNAANDTSSSFMSAKKDKEILNEKPTSKVNPPDDNECIVLD